MADEQRTSRVEQLQEQVNQRVRQAVDDLQRELRERLRRAGDQIVGELESRLGDEPSLPDSFLSPDELSHLAEEAATAARDQARRESVGSLTPSLAALDRAGSQKGVLDTLVTEAGRFAGRSAVFLVRGDALELWGAHGWGAGLDGTRIPLADEGPWSSDSLSSGTVDVGSTYCGELCSQVEAPLPGAAILIPLFLRDKLAAVVYADHEQGEGLATEALQGLTYVAALTLESLPFRKRESTPTLSRAGAAGPETAEPETTAAPESVGLEAAGVEATGVEDTEPEAGGAEMGEPAEDTLDEASSLDDVYGAPSFEDADTDLGDTDLGDTDLGDSELADGGLEDTDELSADELTADDLGDDLEGDTLGGDADFSYDLEDDLGDASEETDEDSGELPADEPESDGGETEVDRSLEAEEEEWSSEPDLESDLEDGEGTEEGLAADEAVSDEAVSDEAPSDEPEAELSPAATPAETVYAPVPPPPAAPEVDEPEVDEAESDEPEPAAEEAPAKPAQVTPPSAGGGQVAPPSDLEGPGRAFAKQEPRTEEEARHDEARRLARLLVSEIRLYNEDEVDEGRRNNDIYQRLKEDIDRSRQMYEERVDAGVRDSSDYFYDELVRNLAGGDEGALGL